MFDFDILDSKTLLGESGFYLNRTNEIVFLDITADGCITCKFNKINVLNSKTVSDFFDSQEVTLIKADWRQPNKKINKFLKK